MAESWNTTSCSSNQRKKILSIQEELIPFLKGAPPVRRRMISMEMEKRFPELLFQIVNRASGRVSCTETWNYSQILKVTMMILMMQVIMIIQLTILTPSFCRQESKGGLQQQQKVECIVWLRSKEFLKFLVLRVLETFE